MGVGERERLVQIVELLQNGSGKLTSETMRQQQALAIGVSIGHNERRGSHLDLLYGSEFVTLQTLIDARLRPGFFFLGRFACTR